MGRGRLEVDLYPLSGEGTIYESVTSCKLLEQIFYEMTFLRSRVTIGLIDFQ